MLLTGNEIFIHVASARYPLTFAQVRRELSSVAFGTSVDSSELVGLGYQVVTLVERPVGDVVVEKTPALVDGEYRQVWEARAFTEEERTTQLINKREVLKAEIDTKLAEALYMGTPHDFGGEFGVLHIQLRDGDRVNVTGLRVSAESDPTFTSVFRTRENRNVPVNAQEIISMSKSAINGYTNKMGMAWVLKDQINAATSEAEFPEVPEAF